MRGDVLHHAVPGGLELRHHVERRRLDQVHLPREQRVAARDGIGRADQHHPVHLRHPRRVPVAGVPHQLRPLPRDESREPEGAGARGLGREAIPGAAELLELRRRGDEEPEKLVGEEAVHRLGGQLHRHRVELPPGGQRGQPRPHLRRLALVELRRLRVHDLLEVPDHRLGVEGRAVVEGHARPQRQRPALAVRRVGLPGGRQPRHQLARPVGDVHLPGDERVVDRVARELVGPRAAVGLPRGEGDIGHRDAVAQHPFRLRARFGNHQARGKGGEAGGAQQGAARQGHAGGSVGGATRLATPVPERPYPRTSMAERSPSLTMLKHMLVRKMQTPGSIAINGWL